MTFKYYYELDFTILTGLTPQFEWSFGKVIEAHAKHKRGLAKKMVFYRTFVGGNDVITLSVPMNSLAEMDLWMHTPEIVLEHFGKEEGLKILQLYCDATLGWESRIKIPYDPLKILKTEEITEECYVA